MKYTKKNNLLKRNKLLFKKKTLKKKTIKKDKKTQNYNNKIKKKTRTKTKTKHKGGNSFYNENGYHVIKDVNLNLDLTQSKKKRSIYKTQYSFYRQDKPQLNFIKNNNGTNIHKLLKKTSLIMNNSSLTNIFIGMDLQKKKIKNGKFKGYGKFMGLLNYYLFSINKYVKIYSSKKTIRCGILYFHSIPNNEKLNLKLSIGKQTKKKSFKKKNINEVATIPIKEKTAILLRNDTYFKFKMNKITLDKPIVILEFNLNCDNNINSNLFKK